MAQAQQQQNTYLRHGDLVTLAIDSKGFVAFENMTDSAVDVSDMTKSELCVLPMESQFFPPNFLSRCVFEVGTGHGYEAAGQPVKYGAGVRLIHYRTRRFLAATSQPTASSLNNFCLRLAKSSQAGTMWDIMPRFKMRSEGEKVYLNDQVVLSCRSFQGQFLAHDDEKTGGVFQLYTGSSSRAIRMRPFSFYDANTTTNVKGGDLLRFLHKEVESYLNADLGDYPCRHGPNPLTAIVDLMKVDRNTTSLVSVKHSANASKKKNTTRSTNSIWQVECATPDEGGVINWMQAIRFKHAITGQYMAVKHVTDLPPMHPLHAAVAGESAEEEKSEASHALLQAGTAAKALMRFKALAGNSPRSRPQKSKSKRTLMDRGAIANVTRGRTDSSGTDPNSEIVVDETLFQSEDWVVTTTSFYADEDTLFELLPVISDNTEEAVVFGAHAVIAHAESGAFLKLQHHGRRKPRSASTADEEEDPKKSLLSPSEIGLSVDNVMSDGDVFSLVPVEHSSFDDLLFVQGMIPGLLEVVSLSQQRLDGLDKQRNAEGLLPENLSVPLPSEEELGKLRHMCMHMLRFVGDSEFLTDDISQLLSEPMKTRQDALRSQRVIELLMCYLRNVHRAYFTENGRMRGEGQDRAMKKACALAHALLKRIIQRNMRSVERLVGLGGVLLLIEQLPTGWNPPIEDVFDAYTKSGGSAKMPTDALSSSAFRTLIDQLHDPELSASRQRRSHRILDFMANVCAPGNVSDARVQAWVRQQMMGDAPQSSSLLFSFRMATGSSGAKVLEVCTSNANRARPPFTPDESRKRTGWEQERPAQVFETEQGPADRWEGVVEFLVNRPGSSNAGPKTASELAYFRSMINLFSSLCYGSNAAGQEAVRQVVKLEHIMYMLSRSADLPKSDLELWLTLLRTLYVESYAASSTPQSALRTVMEWSAPGADLTDVERSELRDVLRNNEDTKPLSVASTVGGVEYPSKMSEEQVDASLRRRNLLKPGVSVVDRRNQLKRVVLDEMDELDRGMIATRNELKEWLLRAMYEMPLTPSYGVNDEELDRREYADFGYCVSLLRLARVLLAHDFFSEEFNMSPVERYRKLTSRRRTTMLSGNAAQEVQEDLAESDKAKQGVTRLDKILTMKLWESDPQRCTEREFATGAGGSTALQVHFDQIFMHTNPVAKTRRLVEAKIEICACLQLLMDLRQTARLRRTWDIFKGVYIETVEAKLWAHPGEAYSSDVVVPDDARHRLASQAETQLRNRMAEIDLLDNQTTEGAMVSNMLFNMTLYNDVTISSQAYKLLYRQFNQFNEFSHLVRNMTLVLDEEAILARQLVDRQVKEFEHLGGGLLTRSNETLEQLLKVFNNADMSKGPIGLTEMCFRSVRCYCCETCNMPTSNKAAHNERHHRNQAPEDVVQWVPRRRDLLAINQELLRAGGAHSAVLLFLRRNLKGTINEGKLTAQFTMKQIEVFKECYRFLLYFCQDNEHNRDELATEKTVRMLIAHLDAAELVPDLLAEVCNDNKDANDQFSDSDITKLLMRALNDMSEDRCLTGYLGLISSLMGANGRLLDYRQNKVVSLLTFVDDRELVQKVTYTGNNSDYKFAEVVADYCALLNRSGATKLKQQITPDTLQPSHLVEVPRDSRLAFHLKFLGVLGLAAAGKASRLADKYVSKLLPESELMKALSFDTPVALRSPILRLVHGAYFEVNADEEEEGEERPTMANPRPIEIEESIWSKYWPGFYKLLCSLHFDITAATAVMRDEAAPEWMEDMYTKHVFEVVLPFLTDVMRSGFSFLPATKEQATEVANLRLQFSASRRQRAGRSGESKSQIENDDQLIKSCIKNLPFAELIAQLCLDMARLGALEDVVEFSPYRAPLYECLRTACIMTYIVPMGSSDQRAAPGVLDLGVGVPQYDEEGEQIMELTNSHLQVPAEFSMVSDTARNLKTRAREAEKEAENLAHGGMALPPTEEEKKKMWSSSAAVVEESGADEEKADDMINNPMRQSEMRSVEMVVATTLRRSTFIAETDQMRAARRKKVITELGVPVFVDSFMRVLCEHEGRLLKRKKKLADDAREDDTVEPDSTLLAAAEQSQRDMREQYSEEGAETHLARDHLYFTLSQTLENKLKAYAVWRDRDNVAEAKKNKKKKGGGSDEDKVRKGGYRKFGAETAMQAMDMGVGLMKTVAVGAVEQLQMLDGLLSERVEAEDNPFFVEWTEHGGRFIRQLLKHLKDLSSDDLTSCNLFLISVMQTLLHADIEHLRDDGADAADIAVEIDRLTKKQEAVRSLGAAEMVMQVVSLAKDGFSALSPYYQLMVPATLTLGNRLLNAGNQAVQADIVRIYRDSIDSGSSTREFFYSLRSLLRYVGEQIPQLGASSASPEIAAERERVRHLTTTVLRFLHLMCEGHNRDTQIFLQTQGGVETVNLVKETVQLMRIMCEELVQEFHYYDNENFTQRLCPPIGGGKRLRLIKWIVPPDVPRMTMLISMVVQALHTMTEMVQGPCQPNQIALVRSNVCSHVKPILEYCGAFQVKTWHEHKRPWEGDKPGLLLMHYQDAMALLKDEGVDMSDPESMLVDAAQEYWRAERDYLKAQGDSHPELTRRGTVDQRKLNISAESMALVGTIPQLPRLRDYTEILRPLLIDLESAMLDCLLGLLEGGVVNEEVITQIISSIDIDQTIWNLTNLWFRFNTDPANRRTILHENAENTAFLYYTVLNLLADSKLSGEVSEKFEALESTNEANITSKIGHLEILGDDRELQLVYFPIPRIVQQQWKRPEVLEYKNTLLFAVNRDNPEEKVKDYMAQMEPMMDVLRHHQMLTDLADVGWPGGSVGCMYDVKRYIRMVERSILTAIVQGTIVWRSIVLVLSIILNVLLLEGAEFDMPAVEADGDRRLYETEDLDGLLLDDSALIQKFAYVHLFMSIMLFISYSFSWGWLYSNQAVAAHMAEMDDADRTAFRKSFRRQTQAHVLFSLINTTNMYNVILLVCSFFGCFHSPLFFAVGIFDYIKQNRSMGVVLQSVTKNFSKLLVTYILAVLVMYFFAVTTFAIKEYRNTYNLGGHKDCANLLDCFLLQVGYGFMNPPDFDEEGAPPNEAIPFNIIYVLFVNLIITAIVSGIIIDTFGEMREENDAALDDMDNKCFICGLDRDNFESLDLSFEEHIKQDHFMWQYLWFRLHLEEKDHTEHTGQEQYVWELIQQKKNTFYPLKKAMIIQGRIKEKADLPGLMERVNDVFTSHRALSKTVLKQGEALSKLDTKLDKILDGMKKALSK